MFTDLGKNLEAFFIISLSSQNYLVELKDNKKAL